ncbi:MAG: DUF378 domain-containing protein [Candidatus Eisenbacteria bacterium]|nr:DUF378 domain-containing protein [Candidatus Eisenbacteria bacterium]
MKTLDVVIALLLIVGGLNWGLVGLFHFNLVAAIFGGAAAPVARVIYVVVGLSAIYELVFWKAIRGRWHGGSAGHAAG